MLIKAAERRPGSSSTTTTPPKQVSHRMIGNNLCIPSGVRGIDDARGRDGADNDARSCDRVKEDLMMDDDNVESSRMRPTHGVKKYASKDVMIPGPSHVVRSVVGSTRAVVRPNVADNTTRTDDRVKEMSVVMKNSREVWTMRYDDEESSRSMLCGEAAEHASKDALMTGPSCVVRPDVGSMRPGVWPDVPGQHQGCLGGGEELVPVVPDKGMPGGGEEKSSLKTKPNRVKGGLMARVHFWEMKTDNLINEKQGERDTETKTDGDLRSGNQQPKRKQYYSN